MQRRTSDSCRLICVLFCCFCVYVVVVFPSRLSQTVSVVSVVQITLNSHVRNLIEVITFTLCSVSCLVVCLVVLLVSTNHLFLLQILIGSEVAIAHTCPYTACSFHYICRVMYHKSNMLYTNINYQLRFSSD